jgi:hypothetical protein
MSEFSSEDAEGDGEMGFADAGRAQQENIATFGQEATGGQLLQQGPVDGGLEGEVKVFDALEVRQTGKTQVGLDDALAACGQLGFEQASQKVGAAPFFGSSLLSELVELCERGGSADLFEGGQGELFVGYAHLENLLVEAQGTGLDFHLVVESEGGTLQGDASGAIAPEGSRDRGAL